jgi:hypothetical protein
MGNIRHHPAPQREPDPVCARPDCGHVRGAHHSFYEGGRMVGTGHCLSRTKLPDNSATACKCPGFQWPKGKRGAA